jgi:hypothetical protein
LEGRSPEGTLKVLHVFKYAEEHTKENTNVLDEEYADAFWLK